MATHQPVAETERVLFWDVLRGVAVLGILLANMPYYSMAEAAVKLDLPFGHGSMADQAAQWLVFFVADTKFITIFSVLFGAGLAFQWERAVRRGDASVRPLCRRLGLLLLFGLIHGLLIWFGDILTTYAVLGFVALLFRGASARTLRHWSITLLLIALVLWMLPALGATQSRPRDVAADLAATRHVFASGDFLNMIKLRAALYGVLQAMLLLFFSPRTLGLFLLGMALVKVGWFTRPQEHRPLFRRCVWIGLGLGIPLHALAAAGIVWKESTGWTVAGSGAFFFAGLLQAAGYTGVVALWSQAERVRALRDRLAAVGRMAFTNYLAHGVLTALIFNYAGLYDRLGRFQGLLLTFAIFALQLAWSPWWLARFHMGPLEWLWRAGTYGRSTPFRRALPDAASI